MNSYIHWPEVSVTSRPRFSAERDMENPWISGRQGMPLSHFVHSDVDRVFSVITYVLLCGYAPFRSEDPKELIRETMAAKVEFHDRYWKSVSKEGAATLPAAFLITHISDRNSLAKNFIKSLLTPNPIYRPTAAAALIDHVRIRFSAWPPWNSHDS